MKEVWVLSVKTSLPETCMDSDDLKSSFTVFKNFEKGRDEFRRIVKEYAFSENAMFDGKGNIIHLNKYAEDSLEDENDHTDNFLYKERLLNIAEWLKTVFNGEDVDFKMLYNSYDDAMISLTTVAGEIEIIGDYDGPINGINPHIKTNIFSMKEEKDYYLYIDDMFRQDCSAELYIDLKKAEVK